MNLIRHVYQTIKCGFSRDCRMGSNAYKDDPLVQHFEAEAERARQEAEVIKRRTSPFDRRLQDYLFADQERGPLR